MRTYTPDSFPATFRADVLGRQAVVKLPSTYFLGHPGAGCFGDPPGYPSYYVRPVYTRYGNAPPRNSKVSAYVLFHADGTLRAVPDYPSDFYRRVYAPLPVDHPRVLAWIDQTMQHFHSCYADEERQEYGRSGTLIYPLPSYKLRATTSTHPDIRVRSAEQHAAKRHNAYEEKRAEQIATLDNHKGVRAIREVYPDWTPSISVGAYRTHPHPGDWWTTMQERPTPETCPGIYGNPHRADGWCQFCGYNSTPGAGASADG